jgi:hypothetical protein
MTNTEAAERRLSQERIWCTCEGNASLFFPWIFNKLSRVPPNDLCVIFATQQKIACGSCEYLIDRRLEPAAECRQHHSGSITCIRLTAPGEEQHGSPQDRHRNDDA